MSDYKRPIESEILHRAVMEGRGAYVRTALMAVAQAAGWLRGYKTVTEALIDGIFDGFDPIWNPRAPSLETRAFYARTEGWNLILRASHECQRRLWPEVERAIAAAQSREKEHYADEV